MIEALTVYRQFEPMLWKAAHTYSHRFPGSPSDQLEEAFQEAGLIFTKALRGYDPDKGSFCTLLFNWLTFLGGRSQKRSLRQQVVTGSIANAEFILPSSLPAPDRSLTFWSLVSDSSPLAQKMVDDCMAGRVDSVLGLQPLYRERGYPWKKIYSAVREIRSLLREV